jgi:hypothetical protein
MTITSHEPTPRIIQFYRFLWRAWKERRFQRFITTIKPRAEEHLLDIGGYPFNWFRRGSVFKNVDVLNIKLALHHNAPPNTPSLKTIEGDARKLPFPDKTYDIIFSNSVIEHVGTLSDQQAFAAEARRVGKKLWIQTPAKECPIEPHYLGLFIHWLPHKWHVFLARWTSVRGITGSANRADLKSIASSTRLLSKKEMKELFPDCKIWTERIFVILPKSHVAIRQSKIETPACRKMT